MCKHIILKVLFIPHYLHCDFHINKYSTIENFKSPIILTAVLLQITLKYINLWQLIQSLEILVDLNDFLIGLGWFVKLPLPPGNRAIVLLRMWTFL